MNARLVKFTLASAGNLASEKSQGAEIYINPLAVAAVETTHLQRRPTARAIKESQTALLPVTRIYLTADQRPSVDVIEPISKVIGALNGG